MVIWAVTPTVAGARLLHQSTLVSHLGIEISEIGEDFIVATMPVDERTVQPHGVLHGGASLALAESVGSFAANWCVDRAKYYCVGLDINGNHIRPATGGLVKATARPLHLGRKTQVWRIVIEDSEQHLVCESRLPIAVVEKPIV